MTIKETHIKYGPCIGRPLFIDTDLERTSYHFFPHPSDRSKTYRYRVLPNYNGGHLVVYSGIASVTKHNNVTHHKPQG